MPFVCATEWTAIPVFAILTYNLIYPVATQLTARDTLHPSYHIRDVLHKCLHLSYKEPTFASMPLAAALKGSSSSSQGATYLKGIDDLYFVAYWILVFMLARECVMRYVFAPLGRVTGVSNGKDLIRFAEQGWNVVYYTCGWTAGFYIMQHSDYRNLNVQGLWRGYPHYKLSWETKAYYLLQAAFWVSQIMVIHIEKRRKDHYQVRHCYCCSGLFLSHT